ncbi:hypothetical protein M758_1G261100 [Ceratodon purpureus]|nr:hypothetical protein M758_1G261100 [Ceratodon purpureus]
MTLTDAAAAGGRELARERNMVIRECDGTFANMESTHATRGEAQRNLVFGEPVMLPQEMAAVIEGYVADGGVAAPVEELEKIREILLEAITLARTGQAMKLINVFTEFPAAMAKYLNGDDVSVWSQEAEFHSQLFEVMWRLVELTVVMLSDQVEFPVEISSDHSMRLHNVTLKLLEALCAAFDSRSRYFQLREEKDTRREALVCWWRLESALRAPGFFVKVSGVGNGQTHYFCNEKGLNHDGEACECCRPPPEADAVLVNLSWHLAKTASGNGYEYMLRFLIPPREISLVTAELLLRPFVQLLGICSIGSTTLKTLIQHVEINSSADFQRLCVNVCSGIAKYVEGILFWSYFKTVYENNLTISDALGHLGTITRWCIGYYGRMELEVVRGSLRKLQKKMWEMLLDAKRFSMTCTSMSAAMEEKSFLPDSDSGDATLDRDWMEQKNVISRILKHPVDMRSVLKVTQFVTIVGKKGLALPQKDFLAIVNERLDAKHFDMDKAEDQKLAAMLSHLDVSGFSYAFLDAALKWMEQVGQIVSATAGAKVISILGKLLVCDKNKELEKRFLTSLLKLATNIPDRDLVSCLASKIADHYTSQEEVEDLKKSAKTSDEQEKLLQSFSSNTNSNSNSFTSNMAGYLIATEAYGQKTKSWKEKEINLQLNSISNLSNFLEIEFPLICSQTAKECLDRVVLAQRLVGNLNTDDTYSFETVMSSAMSLEFRTLVAVQKETLLHSQLLRKVEELSEEHLQAYDAMKQEQHDKILKFFQTCEEEKKSAVRGVIYRKEKFMASVRKAGIITDPRLPLEDIPTRLLRAAGGALHEVTGKHKESLERLPNSDCAVCFLEFSSNRKRACLDPCGHAGSCIKCATREWKRTKTCPMCKSGIDRPVSVPSKLFF